MYRIIKKETGEVIGMTEKVSFIKVNPKNGCFNFATEEEATGVAYASKAYHLFGRGGADGYPNGDAFISTVDGGGEIVQTKNTVAENYDEFCDVIMALDAELMSIKGED